MKFAKLASLFVFITLAVFSVSLTSAQVLTFTPSSISQTIVAGQSSTINFNLTQAGANSSLTWASSSGIVIQSPPSSIATGQIIAVSAIISVPISASGTINSVINVTGNPTGVGANSFASLPITITVTPSSSSGNLTVSTTSSAAVNVNQNASITITNTGSTTFNTVTITETTNPISGTIFSPSSFSLTGGAQQIVQAKPGLSGLKFGENTISFRAESGNNIANGNFKVRKTFCSAGQSITTNLSIQGVDFSNTGEGEDTEWELLDEIEIEMDIQNNNQDDEVDLVAVLGLFDSSGNDVSDELTFLGDSREDEEQVEISIDEDDEATVNWEFKVPANLDSGNYKLAVKVYDEDAGQSRDCVDTSNDLNTDNFYQTISIEQTNDEGRFVIVDEIELDNQLTCGQTVSGQFTVFNVGEDDEERVKITISNRDLGVNIVREITSDLDQGDEEDLDFSFTVPATASSGRYVLEFMTEYDYDDGNYDQEADESTDYAIEVIGCTQNTGNNNGGLTNIAIDADLASDAKAGEELVVIATITNNGNEDADFSISARGYSEWAELTDISPQTISIDAGESKEVTLTMLVNEEASGMQSFDLQVSEGGKVQIQEIEVELASSNVKGVFNTEGSLIWVIGAVNLILIILIIVVAVRMSRR